jgi:hypothetical protein
MPAQLNSTSSVGKVANRARIAGGGDLAARADRVNFVRPVRERCGVIQIVIPRSTQNACPVANFDSSLAR